MACEYKKEIIEAKKAGHVKVCPHAPLCNLHTDLMPLGRGGYAVFGECLDELTQPNNSLGESGKVDPDPNKVH